MERPSVMGYYDHSDRTVNVNCSAFEEASPEYLVSVLLHEVYHGVEYALVEIYLSTDTEYRDLKIFGKAPIYLDELTNYVNGSEDYEKYHAQLIEEDSRKYAEERVQQYIEAIAYVNNTLQQNVS